MLDIIFYSWIIGTSTSGMKKMETNRPRLIGVRQVLIILNRIAAMWVPKGYMKWMWHDALIDCIFEGRDYSYIPYMVNK